MCHIMIIIKKFTYHEISLTNVLASRTIVIFVVCRFETTMIIVPFIDVVKQENILSLYAKPYCFHFVLIRLYS